MANSKVGLTTNAITGILPTANGGTGNTSGGAITATANGADNRVATYSSATALNGEANLTFDGTNLTVGTGDLIIGTSGKGIDFSASGGPSPGTQTSELLDDYEEGTWTPNYVPASGSITVDTNNDLMTYTKIGRFVWLTGASNISSVSSPSGTLQIDGAPFAAGGYTEGEFHSNIAFSWRYQSGAAGILMGYISHASNNIWIEYNDGQTTSNSAVAQKITSASHFTLGGGYATA